EKGGGEPGGGGAMPPPATLAVFSAPDANNPFKVVAMLCASAVLDGVVKLLLTMVAFAPGTVIVAI
ncbi:MAG: hypothetical protein ACREF1_01280, partial [Acetobacteraceae bacterium]